MQSFNSPIPTASVHPAAPRKVSFGTVESKSFEVVEGHHSFGVPMPLTLGWRCLKQAGAVSVDQYEHGRRPSPPAVELHIAPNERRKIIKRSRRKANGGIRGTLLKQFFLKTRTPFFGSSKNRKQ